MATREDAGGTTRPWIAALVAGLFGCLAGALLASRSHDRSEASPTLEIGGVDELDRHVQELTAELRTAARAPARLLQPGDDAASARPAEPLHANPSTDLTPLLTRVDALLAALERSGVASGAAIQFPDEAAMDTARRELFATDSSTYVAAHRLMTYRQIAERYGRPNVIFVNENGSVTWSYRRDDGLDYFFTFIDGLCM